MGANVVFSLILICRFRPAECQPFGDYTKMRLIRNYIDAELWRECLISPDVRSWRVYVHVGSNVQMDESAVALLIDSDAGE